MEYVFSILELDSKEMSSGDLYARRQFHWSTSLIDLTDLEDTAVTRVSFDYPQHLILMALRNSDAFSRRAKSMALAYIENPFLGESHHIFLLYHLLWSLS